uniref:hypothetical protein n=1 Tax=Solidesulfovibrio alcoholivorans TaxID=81406 RepID=UPI0012ECAA42
MFLIKSKNKNESDRVNNPGKKSIPFSGYPKKVLDGKPLKISTVFKKPFDFVEINLKVLAPVQPFGRPKSCILQGIISGQVTGNAGNIQNICSKYGVLIPPEKTIRFDGHLIPYQKPFKNYHIKTAYQCDVHIIPFDLMVSLAPSNRIYSTSILTKKLVMVDWMIVGQLRVARENKPLTKTIKLILSSDHIQTTSPDDSLIYGSEICYENIKNKHREAMAINDYSSMIGINKMHKKYAFFLIVYVYVPYLVYIRYCLYVFISLIRQRGS